MDSYDGNDVTSSSFSLLIIPVAAKKRLAQSAGLPVSKYSRLATDLQRSSRSSSGKKVVKVSLHESGENVVKVSYVSLAERSDFSPSVIFDVDFHLFQEQYPDCAPGKQRDSPGLHGDFRRYLSRVVHLSKAW